MRFHRTDWPGLLIAALAPPALLVLFLAAFEAWDHHGTPLLGAMAGNFAVAGGLAAIFSRFIRHWDIPIGLVVLILVCVAGVNWAQATGNDDLFISTALKWIAVFTFLALNLVVVWQVLTYGLLPILDRRAAAKQSTE